MEKKTIIYFSLLSTIITLIYVIFSYYGYNRYICLHFCSAKSYIDNYSLLESADTKSRTVISLTSTPERMTKLKPVLISLLDQTTKVDEIALSIPYGKEYIIPSYLKDIVQIYRYSVKYNDAGNLIPVLLREREKDTKIILVQDNKIYGKDFIETIVENSEQNPSNAIMINNCSEYLIKPDFFDISVSDYLPEYTYSEWIHKKIKNKIKTISYSENYKIWN